MQPDVMQKARSGGGNAELNSEDSRKLRAELRLSAPPR